MRWRPSAAGGGVYKATLKLLRPVREDVTASVFELLNRMLPTEIIQLPVAEDADRVCAAA